MDNKHSHITLTSSQQKILEQMQQFVTDDRSRCFILTGYAGTGKTTLMRFFVDYLKQQHVLFRLLSTTGRAAKILSNYTGEPASTIHAMIYKYKGFNKDLSEETEDNLDIDNVGQLYIQFDSTTIDMAIDSEYIYIVDEASMISDTETKTTVQALFGTGKTLTELLQYDQRPKAKYIFVGDPCQLPPIEGGISPALDPTYIQHHFGLNPQCANLTEVMRTNDTNTIPQAAITLRRQWKNAPKDYPEGSKVWGKIQISGYKDIQLQSSDEILHNMYMQCIKDVGYNNTIYITRSNAACSKISDITRQKLGFTGNVRPGDILMVQQNQFATGLMNGDFVKVEKINPQHERILMVTDRETNFSTQLSFQEVTVRELFTKKIFTTMLLSSLLYSKENNLNTRLQTGLFLDFIIRMKKQGITQKKTPRTFREKLEQDPYLNALRCKFGYAITCHKAQGGEWDHVFIEIPRNITLNPTKETYQWLYTALTRAKKTAYFKNDFYIS